MKIQTKEIIRATPAKINFKSPQIWPTTVYSPLSRLYSVKPFKL